MQRTRIPVVLVVVVLAIGAVTGGAVAQSSGDDADLYESLEEMVPAYNENADSVNLGPVSIAGTSNIYIEDGDSVVTYSMTIDDRYRITDLSESADDDAVRKITTDRETIERLTAADNPARAFRDAVANDDIVITGEDGQTVERIKWAVINAFKGFFL
ncbi:hypothetical protein EXE53_18575 [Halorubrum sp. SD626R]|uniref:hypothetical protein n=1 Tax=Halorubrum sp. SD626R TaxID=1419722 RepID=UPI0010F63B97|nr:hypothetical protein [Halorubrum sp. SD626R]TKX78930.1 hypothetical protein EXE53_18575 [Halorubrum sp. SD626R]